MVLDLILFRADQGGDPDKIRELQKKRFKDVSHVEKVIETDTRWRKCKSVLGVRGNALKDYPVSLAKKVLKYGS